MTEWAGWTVPQARRLRIKRWRQVGARFEHPNINPVVFHRTALDETRRHVSVRETYELLDHAPDESPTDTEER